eukprot:6778938-Prymnesium_polylepis.1
MRASTASARCAGRSTHSFGAASTRCCSSRIASRPWSTRTASSSSTRVRWSSRARTPSCSTGTACTRRSSSTSCSSSASRSTPSSARLPRGARWERTGARMLEAEGVCSPRGARGVGEAVPAPPIAPSVAPTG